MISQTRGRGEKQKPRRPLLIAKLTGERLRAEEQVSPGGVEPNQEYGQYIPSPNTTTE